MLSNARTAGSLLLAAAALSGPALAAPADPNLLTNGSFETPSLAYPGATVQFYSMGDTSMTGWTVDSLPGASATTAQLTNNAAFGVLLASDGEQYLDLTGNIGRGAGVRAEPVVTDATFDYTLSFDVGALFYQFSFGPATVDLLINGALAGSFTATPGDGDGISWSRYSYSFSGTGAPVSIGLYSSLSLSSSNLGVGLDNVVLEGALRDGPPTGAIPEPASWAMLIAGFGLVGAMARRRRLDSARVSA